MPQEMETTRAITLAMGEYFQIQDDVLDCYGGHPPRRKCPPLRVRRAAHVTRDRLAAPGDPATIGKIGTDIQVCAAPLPRCPAAPPPHHPSLQGTDAPGGFESFQQVALPSRLLAARGGAGRRGA